MSTPLVCIDGPNGVGKTAVARCLARKLGWRWLSVGAVYRALAGVDAPLDASVRLVPHPAPDGTLDPVIQVNGADVTERDLLGVCLGRSAARIAGTPEWQRKVNQELRRYSDGGLVVEGRATQEIFPMAALHVYIWADPAERSRRAAAVTGASHDPERDRNDVARASEALRVRPGAVVWNSTRYSLDDTVAGLLRRTRLATSAEPAIVGICGDPPPADGRRPVPYRLVNAAATHEPLDAVVRVPPGVPPDCRDAIVAAHLRVLLAGNDLVSIGAVRAGDAPTATQRMLEAAPWPLHRWLRVDWLARHGHFAVSADALALAAGSPADVSARAGLIAAGAAMPAPLIDALQGCRWVPNPEAVARCPAADPAQSPRRPGLADLLVSLAAGAAAGPSHVDLRGYPDNRAPLWVLAAAPHQVLDVTLPWDIERPQLPAQGWQDRRGAR